MNDIYNKAEEIIINNAKTLQDAYKSPERKAVRNAEKALKKQLQQAFPDARESEIEARFGQALMNTDWQNS